MLDKTITITLKEFIRLMQQDVTLDLLEAGGVDNWCGYGDSLNMYGEKDYRDIMNEVESEILNNHLTK